MAVTDTEMNVGGVDTCSRDRNECRWAVAVAETEINVGGVVTVAETEINVLREHRLVQALRGDTQNVDALIRRRLKAGKRQVKLRPSNTKPVNAEPKTCQCMLLLLLPLHRKWEMLYQAGNHAQNTLTRPQGRFCQEQH